MEPTDWLHDAHIAPNIQGDPAVYETENRALDPQGKLFEAMASKIDWSHKMVVDLGAGTGFWAPHFAEKAQHVFAIEPHGPSRLIAMKRFATLGKDNISLIAGSAEHIMLATDTVDVVHARFAYFWGPGCEKGIEELERVIRPGGVAFIIDNDLRVGTFAKWLAMLPEAHQRDADVIDAFWRSQGFDIMEVMSCWQFESRRDLEDVVRLELPSIAEAILAEHEGDRVEYGYRIFYRHYAQ